MRTPPSAGCGRRPSELSVKMQKPIGSGRGKSAVPNRFFGVVAESWWKIAPSSVTAGGRDTSCPRCGIRFPGPLGHGNRAAAWLCPRFFRHRRRFGHSPPGGRRGRLVVSVCHATGVGCICDGGGQSRPPLRRGCVFSQVCACRPLIRHGRWPGHLLPTLRHPVPRPVGPWQPGRCLALPSLYPPHPKGTGSTSRSYLAVCRWRRRRFGHSPPRGKAGWFTGCAARRLGGGSRRWWGGLPLLRSP